MVFKKQDLNEVKLIKDEHNKYKLAQKSLLECIKIYFSKNPTKEEILNNLNVKINDESINLENRIEMTENKVYIILSEDFECEYFEIQSSLEFVEVKIFNRKIKGLLIAARNDAFGSRMSAFVTAIYFAKKTGFKFGFVWRARVNKDRDGVFLEKKENLFEKEFLDEFDYSNVLPLGDTNVLCFKSLTELALKNLGVLL